MTLPVNDAAWPPPNPAREEQSLWADLYASRTVGKPAALTPDPDLASGNSDLARERRRVRAGLAADIAATSAALVMGKAVPVETGDPEVQAVLERIDAAGLSGVLRQAEEIASAFGGVVLRAVYDPAVSAQPYLTAIDPTRADLTFVDGRLIAATVWTELQANGATVYRWVETRDNRARTIENALYRGTASNLGSRVPLGTLPETAGLPETQAYPPGVDRMVWYHANALPNRRWPSSPQGRADIQGAESLVAAADIVLTSLISDIRLGRTRIIAPVEALTRGDATSGAYFQQDREVFTSLDLDPSSDAGKITMMQGALRATEHSDALKALVARAVSVAGYSPSTFGLGNDGAGESGEALRIRERRTIATVESKRRDWTPAITDAASVLLALAGYPGQPVTLAWQPVVEDSATERATVIQTLTAARAISTEHAVELAQPHLTPEQVEEEVQRILEQSGLAVPLDGLPGETYTPGA